MLHAGSKANVSTTANIDNAEETTSSTSTTVILV